VRGTPVDRLLLADAMMGQFLSGFGTRIFIVSLPTIAAALHTDIVGISWALIAYQLAGISLSVVFGRMGDMHGRYVIYGLGFVIMAATSLLCGVAPTAALLIVFRFVQGIGAAMISSCARVLAMEAMPEGSEGRANGLMTMAFHGGFLIGPPVGGFLIDLLSWRWIFFLLVPIAVAGTILTAVKAKDRQRASVERPPAIDYLGAGLLVVLTVALTLVLDSRSAALVGAEHQGIVMAALAVTAVAFIAHERRALHPVVNFTLFRIRMFAFSVLSLLVVATTYSVLGLLIPFYLQEVLHLSPSLIGLIFLAAPVFTIVLAPLTGQLTDRIGPRIPAAVGIVLSMGAFAIGAVLRTDSHWLWPTTLMALTGLGTAFFNTPNQTAIIASVPREYRGFATGMVQTVFGIGSLLGISLGGVLLTVMFRHYAGVADARPSAENPLAFVAAMNATYAVCLALMAGAFAASFLRGGTRIEAAASPS
jgi:EmrB/QacA subfamily drug resistance transporter